MAEVAIDILRWVDDSQPGWIECTLTDAYGREHFFVEKVPVVTVERLDADSAYPRRATMECSVVGAGELPDGRAFVTIDTQRPYGVESTAGQSRFEVLRDRVSGAFS